MIVHFIIDLLIHIQKENVIMRVLIYNLRCVTNNSRLMHYTFISPKDGVALVSAKCTVFRVEQIQILRE